MSVDSGQDRTKAKKRVILADVIFCVILVLSGAALGFSHRVQSKPRFLVFPPETGENHCKLIRVVDGDSVHVGLIIDVSARLYGIDTPERGQEGFREATERLESLLRSTEYLRVQWNGRGKYGRYLATIYTEDDGPSVNEILVSEGFAREYLP